MVMKREAVIAAIVMVAALLAAVPARADRLPCGDLLLPYFEVRLPQPGSSPMMDELITTVAVGNSSKDSMKVTLTLWSNWGIPILSTEAVIPPKGMFTANLRDWLLMGHLPDRDLTPDELAHVQAALSARPSPQTGLYYSSLVEDYLAVGYLTASGSGYRPACEVLWGDFFSIDPRDNNAMGESLVRLVGGPSREVCERHMVRFLEGGSFDATTHMVVWVGLGGMPSPDPEPHFALKQAVCTVYDETGLELGQQELELLATQSIPVAHFHWPASFGWVDCEVGAPSFICQCHSAEERYAVRLRSFCVEEPSEPPGPPGEPGIDLQKLTNGQDADFPPGPTVEPGAPVTWEFVVTNTGSMRLVNVKVVDDREGLVECPKSVLNRGESMTCVAVGVAPEEADWPFLYNNEGQVTANTRSGLPVSDYDPSHYVVQGGIEPPPEASLDLEKATNGDDADLPPGPTIPVGDPVSWTYVVTNTGDVALTDVSVMDDRVPGVLCPQTTLAVGESMTCTAQGVAVLGQYANLGTARGFDPEGQMVEATDPSHYFCGEEGEAEGCTPGYWKNHLDSWPPTGYAPSMSVGGVFSAASAYPSLASATLLEALDFGGGPGAEGGAAILLRAGVAALLNSAHPDVGYPWTPIEVISQVDAALASGDRTTMTLLAETLDAANNLGCPLS